jgi:ATP-dependent DNA ligase
VGRTRLPFTLDPLDKRLVLPKPKNSVENDIVHALEKKKRACFTRKRNGYGVVLALSNKAKVYTRGSIRDISENVPHITDEIESVRPSRNSVLCGELLAERDGKDWPEFITRVTQNDVDTAQELQKQFGRVKLMIYNVLVYNGEDVTRCMNEERLRIVHSLFSECRYSFPVEVVNQSFAAAQETVIANKWEGLVVYDKAAATMYRLDGNDDRPPRPYGCWKRKPAYEDDFIVVGWVGGTAGKRHEKRMGKLILAQVHPETGQTVPCGEVGIGFTDEDRDVLADDSRYPFVAEVQFERRFPPRAISKSRIQCALANPRYVRLREDKNPNACVLPAELTAQLVKR